MRVLKSQGGVSSRRLPSVLPFRLFLFLEIESHPGPPELEANGFRLVDSPPPHSHFEHDAVLASGITPLRMEPPEFILEPQGDIGFDPVVVYRCV